jgi:N-terminal domain of galactosyltransferase
MSLRTIVGALIYDGPRFARAISTGRWERMRNRNERVTIRGRGVRCEWKFTSDLHIAKVFPLAGKLLMRSAFAEWPVRNASEHDSESPPVVSFVIGHRGVDRVPHLLATLQSIAGQTDVAFECIVVEQAHSPEISVPPWVRYHFMESHDDYSRGAAFNAGAAIARGELLVLHDNDIVVPAGYAAALVRCWREGHAFIDLKRFLFYLDDTRTRIEAVIQNLVGGSIAADARAFREIGGFDEEFVGWGGEDNDFWDRAETTGKVYRFGELPMIHMFHAPQRGKLMGEAAPAVKRYRELESIPAEERIRRLRERRNMSPRA